MTEQNDIPIENKTEATGNQGMQVNVRMQQGEHAGQPLYSNFASIQGGQGVVIVDFGFLDPQTMNTLNQLVRSGKRVPDTVGARMSCRIALSVEAAHNLAHQLNQLLQKK
ncbi:DUF3467 domain-containing protein [Nitrosomonas ureae]|uniref:Uncharacterized protein n=1 Tax=Nitrosomonas ureae TaxID=44577 RepID=A0A1H9G0X7_9PROT|nr:DUF3467 domain-containing protein [Nitrosomonas ureae]SEQ43731.1 hypothetical protein SAMN05421510_10534 [Nitrosomonas ureae]